SKQQGSQKAPQHFLDATLQWHSLCRTQQVPDYSSLQGYPKAEIFLSCRCCVTRFRFADDSDGGSEQIRAEGRIRINFKLDDRAFLLQAFQTQEGTPTHIRRGTLRTLSIRDQRQFREMPRVFERPDQNVEGLNDLIHPFNP